jgi:hypothetical protein
MRPIRALSRCVAVLVGLLAVQGAGATTYYVDPVNGLDTNPGTSTSFAKKTIAGVTAIPVVAGDIVKLRGGTYPTSTFGSSTDPTKWAGALGNVITVEPYATETVIFDPGLADPAYKDFGTAPNTEWVEDSTLSNGDKVYRSVDTFATDSRWGYDLDSNTRLLSYSRLEELTAINESFATVPLSDPRPAGGPLVTDPTSKNVWTYHGPGIWWDSSSQKIYFRASATHYNQTGVTDYSGQSDPRQMRLAIANDPMVAARFYGKYITFNKIIFQQTT